MYSYAPRRILLRALSLRLIPTNDDRRLLKMLIFYCCVVFHTDGLLLLIKPSKALICNKNNKNNDTNTGKIDASQSVGQQHTHRNIEKFDTDQSSASFARTLKIGNDKELKLRQRG